MVTVEIVGLFSLSSAVFYFHHSLARTFRHKNSLEGGNRGPEFSPNEELSRAVACRGAAPQLIKAITGSSGLRIFFAFAQLSLNARCLVDGVTDGWDLMCSA